MMDLSATTQQMVSGLTEIPERLSASTCFGDVVERDGHTLIPVARVTFGYGLGYGGGSGSGSKPSTNGNVREGVGEGGGGGGGGGGSSTPVAVIDIIRDDVVVRPIVDSTRISMTSMLVGAWLGFWLFQTIRTVARERSKAKKVEAKALAR